MNDLNTGPAEGAVENSDPFVPDGAEGSAGADPFAPENIGVVNFIQLSRIYDTLLALLTIENPSKAMELMQRHAAGDLIGPSPVMNGNFITDLVNETE